MGAAIKSDFAQRSVRLIGALARSSDGNEFARNLLFNLRQQFGIEKTAFVFMDTESFELSYPIFNAIPRSVIEKHRECYRDEGIFLRAMRQDRKLLGRKYLTADDVISAESYERSVYFRDIVRPAGSRDCVLLPVSGNRRVCAALTIYKPERDGAFTPLEKKLFALLSQPLGALFDRCMESLRTREDAMIESSALASLRTGVLVVDQSGRLLRSNPAAERICERLYAEDARSAIARLLAELRNLGGIGGEKAAAFGDFDGSGVDVRLVPESFLTPMQTIAFRYIIHLEERTEDEEKYRRLVDTYALSRREIQVVSQVVAGEGNDEIAGKLFLSEHTVRTHLQNIYRKLSVNNRISIIQLFRELA